MQGLCRAMFLGALHPVPASKQINIIKKFLIRFPLSVVVTQLSIVLLTVIFIKLFSPSCDSDFLRKIAKDTEADKLMGWFNGAGATR